MAEDKKLSALELLERQHVKDSADRKAKIVAAMADLRDAKELVRESTSKVAGLQQENMNASFAYDSKRAEIVAQAKSKAA